MKKAKKTDKNRSGGRARFVFFGTEPLAVAALDELSAAGFVPSIIISGQDQKVARTKEIKVPSEKAWAQAHGVPVLQPTALDDSFVAALQKDSYDFFVVASFGKILPASVLAIPKKGIINVHPSLLPRLRGPSPIRSAILNDERRVGVSIMLMDTQMDHGDLLAQREVPLPDWPLRGTELDAILAQAGAKLLAQILPLWLAGEIIPKPQNHDVATYSEKIEKEDGLLDMSADAHGNLLKIRAYEGWPGTYAFFERPGKSASRRIRVGIIDAHIENEKLVIDIVKPEGKREMRYEEFLRSGAKPIT